MTRIASLLLVLILSSTGVGFACAQDPQAVATSLVTEYIDAWREFYPSAAFAYGDAASAAAFEDYSGTRTRAWLALNAQTAKAARALLAGSTEMLAWADPQTPTDLAVLLAQTEDELASWDEDAPITQQPQWYAEQISQALTHLLVRDQHSAPARTAALIRRLQGVQALCELGTNALAGGSALRSATALRTLAGTREFYAQGLRDLVARWPAAPSGAMASQQISATVSAIARLEAHITETVMPRAAASAAIGVDIYAAKLARRTGALYTPASLLADAGAEMQAVRTLMYAEAARWRAQLPEAEGSRALAALQKDALLAAAIAAMEADRQDNSADFLASFTELTFAAERFVEDKGLATIPKPTTLLIALSPAHFSGAAVGGVYPSGPFAPEADTLFYIPSIPDTAPLSAREGFYRSFNTHFNTMILSHEMFPGHYLQYKVAVTEAPMLRALFANGSYTEGWGSFVEALMLDAGWADNAPLTRLAHLRKRLENATRAYVSVQVNTAGWGEDEVLAFARTEGLLAPQFATNLWQRVVNSPLQITDYFTGYRAFLQLFADYQSGIPNRSVRPWVDAVLRAGPIPMVMLDGEIQRQLAR